MTEHQDSLKVTLDIVSIGTVFGSLIGWLPAVAALLSIVWSLIRIYETETIQKLIKKK